MATRANRKKSSAVALHEKLIPPRNPFKFEWKFMTGILGTLLALMLIPAILNTFFSLTGWRWGQFFVPSESAIASLFTPQIHYWSGNINRWAKEYNLDPNLLATIMQIESCGHPGVSSSAGAQGLFQVMPFHFETGELSLDPDTNAMRSAKFIQWCSNYTDGDMGLTLACYNGGGLLNQRNFSTWPQETKRYYVWGLGIYLDAMANRVESQPLKDWLNAGGSRLCSSASHVLGLS